MAMPYFNYQLGEEEADERNECDTENVYEWIRIRLEMVCAFMCTLEHSKHRVCVSD